MRLDWDDFYRTGRHQQAWEWDGPSPELEDFLATHPPGPGQAALDVGGGSGQDAVHLARVGWRAAGVDVSAEALALARQRSTREGVSVAWHQADVLALPFPDASFHLVTDRGCFHHIPDAQRDAYAREVARVLAPGGTLLLRGCRLRKLPFFPLSPECLQQHFPGHLFQLQSTAQIDLKTNAGILPALLCRLVRKESP